MSNTRIIQTKNHSKVTYGLPTLRKAGPRRKMTVYKQVGEGWFKQKKMRFTSLKIFPEALPDIIRVAKAGLPINLTVLPNPAHPSDPSQPPLRVFLNYSASRRP